MKWLKCISLVLSFLLLILSMMIIWILNTQSGLHFAINTVVRLLPGLKITTISGDWSDLNFYGVRYQTKCVNLNIDNLNLSLKINCLKHFQLCVNNISTNGVNIKINSKAFKSTKKAANSTSLSKLKLSTLYPILLNQLIIKNINIQIDNKSQISLDELIMAVDWQSNLLRIKPMTINKLVINLQKSLPEKNKTITKVAIKNNNKITNKSPVKILKALLFANPLLANLSEIVLPIDINIKEILGKNWCLNGDTKVTISNLLLIANVQNQQIDIKEFIIIMPEGKITINGDANLSQQWPVNIAIQAESYFDNFKGQQVNLKLEGTLLQQLKLMLSLTGLIKTNLTAEIALSQTGLPIQLTLESQQLNWPLQGEPKYYFKDLHLCLNGVIVTGYNLSFRTDINGRNFPSTLLTLDATVNKQQFLLKYLRLNTLHGKTELTAIIDWSKIISWNGLLTLSDINTAKQWPQWPAKLHGKIVTTGSLDGDNWQLKFPEITLDGNVNGHLLCMRGQINGNTAGQWDVPVFNSVFNILLGGNKLDINGNLSKSWQLDGVIDAPTLNDVLPNLSGIIKGRLKLRGDFKSPQLLIDITTHNFKWQDRLAINKATIQGNIYSDKQIHGQVIAVVQQLKLEDLIFYNFKLDAKGYEEHHNINIQVDGKPISGHLTLSGSLDRQKELWQAVLDNTLLNTPVGEWKLSRPLLIEYIGQQQEVIISPHCWLNSSRGHFCFSKIGKFGEFNNADVLVEQFNLGLLKPFLPSGTQLIGSFNGDIKVSWCGDRHSLKMKVNLFSDNVKIKQLIEETLLPIEFQKLRLNVDINNNSTVLYWLIQITNNGKFSGNIRIDKLKQTRKLSGNITINNILLALIRPILSNSERLDGNLNANLRLSGNINQPLLNGNLTLSNIAAKGHWSPPIDINRGFLKLNFMGTSSQLIGRINTPEGYLNLIGEADWSDIKTRQARISVTGSKLRITLPSIVRIDMEPKIVLKATPNLLSINGSINIPWGRIVVQELPESAVVVSSDEVMLDATLHPIEKKGISIPISTNLEIKIGNDVRLDAFGLKAQLIGILKVIQDKQGLGLNGQINIPEGRFQAYGQDLIVRKGQFLFSGPADQPFLNIEAIHNPDTTNDNVVAVVRVTGFADKPKVMVFSEPIKSQEETLSYLLRGDGLDNNRTDNTYMTSLLISLGVSRSKNLLGSIGEIFGVSDLALDTQGVGNQSQVVVSGKITNDLQVKYGVGIFNSLAKLTLQYRLMPKLYLEVVSGVNQALDLVYQFQF